MVCVSRQVWGEEERCEYANEDDPSEKEEEEEEEETPLPRRNPSPLH